MRKIPQANDINKVKKLVEAISMGANTYVTVAGIMGFNERQSGYYAEAAEMLGLVDTSNGSYKLTKTGEEFVAASGMAKEIILASKIIDIKIFRQIFVKLLENNRISNDEIIFLIYNISELNETTSKRRASTILAWLKWISNELSLITIERDGVSLIADNKEELEKLLA
jgi:hypothetical protein